MVPREQITLKIKRKIIQIEEEKCDGCGKCVSSCVEGAIRIADGKAYLAAEKFCDGSGACLGACPREALKIVERAADEFEEIVMGRC
jgi:MinD superfamily P-loop ATPase